MTAMDQNKTRCEQEHGTEHLPADLRDLIYSKAWQEGHPNGEEEVVNCYADFAEVALAACRSERQRISAVLKMRGDDLGCQGYCNQEMALVQAAHLLEDGKL